MFSMDNDDLEVDIEFPHKEVANCTVNLQPDDGDETSEVSETPLCLQNEHFSLRNTSSFNYYTTYYLNMKKFLSREVRFLVDSISLFSIAYRVTYLLSLYLYVSVKTFCTIS